MSRIFATACWRSPSAPSDLQTALNHESASAMISVPASSSGVTPSRIANAGHASGSDSHTRRSRRRRRRMPQKKNRSDPDAFDRRQRGRGCGILRHGNDADDLTAQIGPLDRCSIGADRIELRQRRALVLGPAGLRRHASLVGAQIIEQSPDPIA